MKAPLEVIADLGVSTSSYIAAVRTLNSEQFEHLTKEDHERLTTEIIGIKDNVDFESDKEARIYFLYSVQETIRAFSGDTVPDMEDVWKSVLHRVQALRQREPWAFKEYESYYTKVNGEERVDDNGKPKPKKGAKKEKAERLYKENMGKGLKRKDFIELFVKELDMTPAGASTYHANMKREFGE